MKLIEAPETQEQEKQQATRRGASALTALLCFFGLHKWEYQYDAGRKNAVTWPGTGSQMWMSDTRICCGRCGKERGAKTAADHDLPEII